MTRDAPRVSDAERVLVRSFLDSREARQEVLSELKPGEMEGLATAPIIEAMADMLAGGQEPTVQALMDRLPEGAPRELLARLAFQPSGEAGPIAAARSLASVRRDRMIAERRRVQKEIDSAGGAVPDMLLRRKMDLVRKINQLS